MKTKYLLPLLLLLFFNVIGGAAQNAKIDKQYSRRGYGDKSMNTDDLVWNASLARSFCKGRLTLTAEGFDILHQLSNTTYTVNAQGRTEVWRNTIPNYVMMHVAYKLTKMPKKK